MRGFKKRTGAGPSYLKRVWQGTELAQARANAQQACARGELPVLRGGHRQPVAQALAVPDAAGGP
eukprot:385746-Lingulodinium_polyedra.AAC.1